MRFNPVSEQEAEAQSLGLWPDGTYDFEVKEATEKLSKTSGNEMIELQVWLFNTDGGRRMVYDYLVSNIAWKIRQFCASCQLLQDYEDGKLEAYGMVGQHGKCVVGTQKAGEDKNGVWREAKNFIKQYVKSAPEYRNTVPKAKAARRPVDDLEGEEIPF